MVGREDYRKSEQKKVRAISCTIWLSIFYHCAQVAIPVVSLITCEYYHEDLSGTDDCNVLAN